MPRVKIGISVGSTIQVGQMDFMKPSVWAELEFDDIPSDQELKERWDWVWKSQIEPQAEELIDLMSRHMANKLGPYRDHSVDRPHTRTETSTQSSDGVYQ